MRVAKENPSEYRRSSIAPEEAERKPRMKKKHLGTLALLVVVPVLFGAVGLRAAEPVAQPDYPPILSAYLGGSGPATLGRFISYCAPLLADIENPFNYGLPVTFRDEIDETTLDAADFQVLFDTGDALPVTCAMLEPAYEGNENRTVLLIVDLTGYPTEALVAVEVVGEELFTESFLNLGSAPDQEPLSVDVTQNTGISAVLATRVPWDPNEGTTRPAPIDTPAGSIPAGLPCSSPETRQVVRVTWAAGVIPASGSPDLDIADLDAFTVVLANSRGRRLVHPTEFADLGDGDNITHLCIDSWGTPVGLIVEAGVLSSPAGFLNSLHVIPIY